MEHGDPGRARSSLEAALESFATPDSRVLVDTADGYGSEFGEAERVLGEVLAAAPGLRARMVLATKAGIRPGVPYDNTPGYLRAACEDSLRRLRVDVIDLFQVHRLDLFTAPAEVAATLSQLRSSGKVREVGVSNASVSQLDDLAAHRGSPLAAVQAEYSLVDRRPLDDGGLAWCLRHGSVPLAYSPLGGGRVLDELGEPLDVLARRESTEERPVPPAAVALAWVAAHPSHPVAIVGTQRPERIRSLATALDLSLSRADLYALLEAAQGHPMP
jgi:aryl-alcohol dehydrogenase-like predicted oxidoreductase